MVYAGIMTWDGPDLLYELDENGNKKAFASVAEAKAYLLSRGVPMRDLPWYEFEDEDGNSVVECRKVLREFEEMGFTARVEQMPEGFLCGYVYLPEGHPLYGMDEDEIDTYLYVYGGVTFAGEKTDGSGWAVGFDTAGDFMRGRVWTVGEIEEELHRMIGQLKRIEMDMGSGKK